MRVGFPWYGSRDCGWTSQDLVTLGMFCGLMLLFNITQTALTSCALKLGSSPVRGLTRGASTRGSPAVVPSLRCGMRNTNAPSPSRVPKTGVCRFADSAETFERR